MKSYQIIITAVMFYLIGGISFAQERFTAELRPGLNFPIEKFAGARLNTGYGFEFTVAYQLIPFVDVYAGWGWNKFNAKEVFLPSRADVEETGYTAGIQFVHPIKNSSLSYLIRGGAVYNHLEIEDVEGEHIAGSDHGLGWQVEAGVSFVIGSNWSLRPTVRYRNLPGHIDVFNGQIDVDLSYISLGTSLVKRF